MPTDQKAETRPIAFVLHDTVRGATPVIHQLVIRPEDLVRTDTSRMTVNQTLGGAWVDSFGPGLTTVNISGHTGWGGGGRPDGFAAFKELYESVFASWHSLRDEVAAEGKNPDGIKLVFDDGLDEFTWVMAPQNFVLKRNKSRPLLSQYQISMIKIDDKVPEIPPPVSDGASESAGVDSLTQSISKIDSFAASIKGDIAAALGPITSGVKDFVQLTSDSLKTAKGLISAGLKGLSAVSAPILEIASGLTKAAVNMMNIVSSIKSIAQSVKAQFMAAKAAFNNAFCLLRNVFNAPATLPDYSDLYGSSNCSSTAGGSPASPLISKNAFQEITPATMSPVSISAKAEASLSRLVAKDPLKFDSGSAASMLGLGSDLTTAAAGIQIVGA